MSDVRCALIHLIECPLDAISGTSASRPIEGEIFNSGALKYSARSDPIHPNMRRRRENIGGEVEATTKFTTTYRSAGSENDIWWTTMEIVILLRMCKSESCFLCSEEIASGF